MASQKLHWLHVWEQRVYFKILFIAHEWAQTVGMKMLSVSPYAGGCFYTKCTPIQT